MRIFEINERPSAFAAVRAHAHVANVGHLTVSGGAPASRWPSAAQPVAFTNLSTQYQSVQQQKSVQLQDAQVRNFRITGRTAKGAGMALVSGVPPRGKPV